MQRQQTSMLPLPRRCSVPTKQRKQQPRRLMLRWKN
jgi:hypothetical protein